MRLYKLLLALVLFPVLGNAQYLRVYPVITAPTGRCSFDRIYLDSATGGFTFCNTKTGFFVKVGSGGAGGGSVTSVSGTTNQIAVATGTTTPVISFPSTIIIPNGSTATTQTSNDNSTKVATTAYADAAGGSPVLSASGVVSIVVSNDTSTGTTTNKLVKITGSPQKAVITGASDTSGVFGICVSGCGTTGSATVAVAGLPSCVFDNATTVNHFVTATTDGRCHDAGASFPMDVQVLGIVNSTNGGAGTYGISFNIGDIASATSVNIKKGNTSSPSADDQVAVSDSSTASTWRTLPNCADSGGNHLNYTASTNTFSCGTSGSGGSGHAVSIPFDSCSPDTTGNIFFQNTVLTNWTAPHWEWVKNSAASLYCFIKIPGNVDATPAASLLLEMAANDSTAGHTDVFTGSDIVITTGAIDVGSLTAESGITFTTTATAYARVTGTASIAATVAANNILVVKIVQTASNSVTNNVFMWPYLQITID